MTQCLTHMTGKQKYCYRNLSARLFCAGGSPGKTTLLKTVVYNQALSMPNQEILVCAPTHGAVKELLWRHFTKVDNPIFHPKLVRYKNNQDMIIELVNGSRLSFKGTENIDALLGREVDLLVLDEWQSHNPEVWLYLEPVLASRGGTALFTGTARRGNHIMDFYQLGQESDMWASWKIKTQNSGSPAGSAQNIKLAKASMSEEEFLQEYCCEPSIGEGLVYPGFTNDNIISKDHEIFTIAALANTPLRIGWDFNVANMHCVVGVTQNNCLYIIDEITQTYANANTASMIAEVKRRYPGRNLLIYPDASGRNRTTNTVDANNTNHQMMRNAGLNLIFDHKGNPAIEDRIILLNSKIKPMEGECTFFVADHCTNVITGLTKRMYKNGKPAKGGKPDYSHAMDALEYVMYHNFANKNTFRQNLGPRRSGNIVADMINGV